MNPQPVGRLRAQGDQVPGLYFRGIGLKKNQSGYRYHQIQLTVFRILAVCLFACPNVCGLQNDLIYSDETCSYIIPNIGLESVALDLDFKFKSLISLRRGRRITFVHIISSKRQSLS